VLETGYSLLLVAVLVSIALYSGYLAFRLYTGQR